MKFVHINHCTPTHRRPRKGAWIEISLKIGLQKRFKSPPQGGVD